VNESHVDFSTFDDQYEAYLAMAFYIHNGLDFCEDR
jgi:hypothetical protein